MFGFSFQGVSRGSGPCRRGPGIGIRSPELRRRHRDHSRELAAITTIVVLVLLVPTMIWVRLRVQWLSRTVEFLCLLPLTIPAIVLVVGLAPRVPWVRQYFGESPLTLFWAYVILVLPYTYRTLDAGLEAIDVQTLSEAARSLGAQLVHGDVPGGRAEHVAGAAQRRGAHRRAGARRVHHREHRCSTSNLQVELYDIVGRRSTPAC